MNELKVLLIGGGNKKLHDFSVMGPIFKEFLEKRYSKHPEHKHLRDSREKTDQ